MSRKLECNQYSYFDTKLDILMVIMLLKIYWHLKADGVSNVSIQKSGWNWFAISIFEPGASPAYLGLDWKRGCFNKRKLKQNFCLSASDHRFERKCSFFFIDLRFYYQKEIKDVFIQWKERIRSEKENVSFDLRFVYWLISFISENDLSRFLLIIISLCSKTFLFAMSSLLKLV